MLGKAFSCLRGRAKPVPIPVVRSAARAFPEGIAQMVSSAGRISLPVLQRMGQSVSRDHFVDFLQVPVLAGSAIHKGTLASAQANSGSREMNRTILFEPAVDCEQMASPSESLKHAVYPLVKGEHANSIGSFFSIGRIDGNDCILPDYAISKKHALIEEKRGIYLLKDSGSTNGTLLNGQRLQTKPVALHDRDVISFARYEFTFLMPGSFYDLLKGV
jgi:hypothetical protein